MWRFLGIVAIMATMATAYPQSNKISKPSVTPPPVPSYALTPGSPIPPGKSGASLPAVASTPSGPVNPFNLTFVVSARGLPNKKKDKVDVDPYIKVFTRTGTTQAGTDWKPIGQTDVYTDNDNPDFYNVFSLVWTKGTNQVSIK
jgi:hypothetical protein